MKFFGSVLEKIKNRIVQPANTSKPSLEETTPEDYNQSTFRYNCAINPSEYNKRVDYSIKPSPFRANTDGSVSVITKDTLPDGSRIIDNFNNQINFYQSIRFQDKFGGQQRIDSALEKIARLHEVLSISDREGKNSYINEQMQRLQDALLRVQKLLHQPQVINDGKIMRLDRVTGKIISFDRNKLLELKDEIRKKQTDLRFYQQEVIKIKKEFSTRYNPQKYDNGRDDDIQDNYTNNLGEKGFSDLRKLDAQLLDNCIRRLGKTVMLSRNRQPSEVPDDSYIDST